MTLDLVRSVATNVRYWAEAQAARENNTDLCGWCARASAHLFRELKKFGINSEIHLWEEFGTRFAHVFLVVEDHVVDVTATQFPQFKNTDVVILHEAEAKAYEFYKTFRTFRNDVELRKHQLKEKWPKHQVAFTK